MSVIGWAPGVIEGSLSTAVGRRCEEGVAGMVMPLFHPRLRSGQRRFVKRIDLRNARSFAFGEVSASDTVEVLDEERTVFQTSISTSPAASDVWADISEASYAEAALVETYVREYASTGAAARSDRLLSCNEWQSCVVGELSNWLTPDHPDPLISKSHQRRMWSELQWANHLGLKTVFLPPPVPFITQIDSWCVGAQPAGGRDVPALPMPPFCIPPAQQDSIVSDRLHWLPTDTSVAEYVRLIQRHITTAGGVTLGQMLVVRLPAILPLYGSTHVDNTRVSTAAMEAAADEAQWDSWLLWEKLRSQAGYLTHLSVALELCEDTLAYVGPWWVERWCAEPLRAVLLPTSIFVENDAKYPVLRPMWKSLIGAFLKKGVPVMLSGQPLIIDPVFEQPPPPPINSQSTYADVKAYRAWESRALKIRPYITYINHLAAIEASKFTQGELANRPFCDALQAPLQPLMDSLEASTYETFEADKAKYIAYEDGIYQALKHIHTKWLNEASVVDSSEEMEIDMPPIVVAVVGAGRGPLVAATLSAAQTAGVKVRIYAVEKNPNAVMTLRQRSITDCWKDKVIIVSSDMRRWNPPERADLLVSELLGSFGDNELSPECLDGAQRHLLKPKIGLSVPSRYTAYIAPVSTPLLWMSARESPMSGISVTSTQFQSQFSGGNATNRGFETPYVVKMNRALRLADAQPCWDFVHPSPTVEAGWEPDNSRMSTLRFISRETTTVHGFGGYFHCDLFGSATLSIVPEAPSPDMHSWFELYFPLATPVPVQTGQDIVFRIWRCCDDHRVWYEWCMLSPVESPVQNLLGRSSCIGL